jgi:hypothetical protein
VRCILCLRLGLAALVWILSAVSGYSQSPSPATVDTATADASVAGTVTGKDGEAYEGVRVSLALAAVPEPQTIQTDASGEFQFDHLPAGPFTLTVTSEGFVTQTVSGVLEAGQNYDTKTIVLPLQEATSEIHVSAAQQVEIAEEQIHIEEQQRVLGVLPNYYVSYSKNPMPLTSKQKFELAFRANVDPYTFLLTGIFAGVEQATNTFSGYGQGMQGYGKRYGALYASTVISNEIGGAILPSVFHQDPRYFYKGTGTVRSRLEYALANAVVCKGDNMHWQFNYSALLGGLATAGISNLYYPEGERNDAQVIFENLGVGFATSALQNIVQEFIVKKLTPSARRAGSQ